jgi:hypothetical protein
MSRSNKKSINQSTINHVRSLPPVGGADPLPAVGAPKAPVRESPPLRDGGRRRLKASAVQVDNAESAARELRSSTALPAMLTERFVRPAQLADALEFSAAWSRQARAAKAWATYAQAQSARAWDSTLQIVESLRLPLEAAMAKDGALAEELSVFAKVMSFRSDAGKRGAATKQRNKRKKQDPPSATNTDHSPGVSPGSGGSAGPG